MPDTCLIHAKMKNLGFLPPTDTLIHRSLSLRSQRKIITMIGSHKTLPLPVISSGALGGKSARMYQEKVHDLCFLRRFVKNSTAGMCQRMYQGMYQSAFFGWM